MLHRRLRDPWGLAVFLIITSVLNLLTGNTNSYSISGSPSLDSKSLPALVYWQHVVMYYAAPVMIGSLILGTLILGIVTLLLSRFLSDT